MPNIAWLTDWPSDQPSGHGSGLEETNCLDVKQCWSVAKAWTSCNSQCYNGYADLPTVPLLAGQSRFWRDSPAFLPDVPRPAKSWKGPAFCTKSDFFLRDTQFVTPPRCPDVNANHPIKLRGSNYGNSVRFLAKIQNGTAAKSPCYSVFWNAIDLCRMYRGLGILLKKSQCGPCQPSRFLPASPAFLREMSL